MFLGSALNFQMSAEPLPPSGAPAARTGSRSAIPAIIISRFGATAPIQKLFSQGLIAAVVDGGMAMLTLAMILDLQPVAFADRVRRTGALRDPSRRLLPRTAPIAGGDDRSAGQGAATTFIETARAIQSIKIFGGEADREAAVAEPPCGTPSASSIRQSRLTIGFKTANQLLYGLENVLVVYLGARASVAGEITIGMLYAFMSYKDAVSRKGHGTDRDWRSSIGCSIFTSRSPLDIALTEREAGYDQRPIGGAHAGRRHRTQRRLLPLRGDRAGNAVTASISMSEPANSSPSPDRRAAARRRFCK